MNVLVCSWFLTCRYNYLTLLSEDSLDQLLDSPTSTTSKEQERLVQ